MANKVSVILPVYKTSQYLKELNLRLCEVFRLEGFDYELIYIDDYAHHPTELKALIDSVRLLYPTKQISLVFQPHLFSRTNDFMEGFAQQLSQVDDLYLLPIYPAREKPIPGVTSDVLLSKITAKSKRLIEKEELIESIELTSNQVVLTVGAGDIDRLVKPLKEKIINESSAGF